MVATIASQVGLAAGLLGAIATPRIHGARHYIFLTHPGEVTHAMLEFLSGS